MREETRDIVHGVNLLRGFVVTDALDARKPQRVAARVAGTARHGVKRDFEHDFGFDDLDPPAVHHRVGAKPRGQGGDFVVGQTAVRLAHRRELAV